METKTQLVFFTDDNIEDTIAKEKLAKRFAAFVHTLVHSDMTGLGKAYVTMSMAVNNDEMKRVKQSHMAQHEYERMRDSETVEKFPERIP
jgi:hypothetical protein